MTLSLSLKSCFSFSLSLTFFSSLFTFCVEETASYRRDRLSKSISSKPNLDHPNLAKAARQHPWGYALYMPLACKLIPFCEAVEETMHQRHTRGGPFSRVEQIGYSPIPWWILHVSVFLKSCFGDRIWKSFPLVSSKTVLTSTGNNYRQFYINLI
jgi:hypothetical protein